MSNSHRNLSYTSDQNRSSILFFFNTKNELDWSSQLKLHTRTEPHRRYAIFFIHSGNQVKNIVLNIILYSTTQDTFIRDTRPQLEKSCPFFKKKYEKKKKHQITERMYWITVIMVIIHQNTSKTNGYEQLCSMDFTWSLWS